jgi:hypothetical protein
VNSASELSTAQVWDAVDLFFPQWMAANQFVTVLSKIDVTERGGGIGLDWSDSNYIKRSLPQTDLETLLAAFLESIGHIRNQFGEPPTALEEAYYPVIATTASELLNLSPQNAVPSLVITAGLRFGRLRQAGSRTSEAIKALFVLCAKRRRGAASCSGPQPAISSAILSWEAAQ